MYACVCMRNDTGNTGLLPTQQGEFYKNKNRQEISLPNLRTITGNVA